MGPFTGTVFQQAVWGQVKEKMKHFLILQFLSYYILIRYVFIFFQIYFKMLVCLLVNSLWVSHNSNFFTVSKDKIWMFEDTGATTWSEVLLIRMFKGQIITFHIKFEKQTHPSPHHHWDLFLVNRKWEWNILLSLNISFHILKEKLFTGDLLLNTILEGALLITRKVR